MLVLKLLIENKEEIIDRLKIKNIDATTTINTIINLNEQRKKTQAETDSLQAELNKTAKEIGSLLKQGDKDKAETFKKRTEEIKTRLNELLLLQKKLEKDIENLLLTLPNTPHISVPKGNSANDNVIIRSEAPILLPTKDYHIWELAKNITSLILN